MFELVRNWPEKAIGKDIPHLDHILTVIYGWTFLSGSLIRIQKVIKGSESLSLSWFQHDCLLALGFQACNSDQED